MKSEVILAAAVALQEFRVQQLAAYCGATSDEVETALATVPGLVEPTGPHSWHVVEASAVRAAISSAEPLPSPHRTQGPAADALSQAGLTARLVVAEETLIECGTESSPGLRQVMAATARNNVLQLLAQLTPGPGGWWDDVEPGSSLQAGSFQARIEAAGQTVTGEIPLPRLRADFELACITGREAAGEPVPADDLMRTATRLRDVLLMIREDGRLAQLFQRFIDLTIGLAGPAGLDTPSETARTRLLVALAWRRVRIVATHDVRQASERVLAILQLLQQERDELAGRTTIDLFRFVEHLPDGWNRLVVYRDLLELLPRQLEYRRQREPLPGVLVEAVADSRASDHLSRIAARLKDALDRSPFKSESALIGQAAHVFNDVAVHTAADTDASVIRRSDQMRRQLLSLVDAPSGE
jgi:hypothetical protein